MKVYLSYFKLRFSCALQYRSAAIAGVFTQLFFGIIYIMVYLAFYESDSSNTPMLLSQLITYLWLNQIFFALVNMWYKDNEIFNLIKNGNISYELCRPTNIYNMWYAKILSTRLAGTLLRALPVLLIVLVLPSPYNLSAPASISALILFALALILGVIVMTSIITIYHVVTVYTLNETGVTNILMAIADILSGLVVPIPFFPTILQTISNYLPFRYISDFPFRIYTGHIGIQEALFGLIIQIIWIIILVIIGKLLMKNVSKRMVVQGG